MAGSVDQCIPIPSRSPTLESSESSISLHQWLVVHVRQDLLIECHRLVHSADIRGIGSEI